MHLTTRNVNTAFRDIVELFYRGDQESRHGLAAPYVVQRPSRNGDVLVIDEPVTITYEQPLERVLFNAARDANPFFHLYEALWMLAGRNDVAPLAFYTSNMKNYSDDGTTLNGAYGRRWRKAPSHAVVPIYSNDYGKTVPTRCDVYVDQLDTVVQHLRANPTSRRAVLQMWSVEDDLLKIGGACSCGADRTGPSAEAHDRLCPAVTGSKDVCCNLSVMFSLRKVSDNTSISSFRTYLDMTVTNRSNDLVWGLLGANYVHFSVLQEYMACKLGVQVGRYHHFTNNLHAYKSNFQPTEWLEDYALGGPCSDRWHADNNYTTVPLLRDEAVFNEELCIVLDGYRGEVRGSRPALDALREPFLRTVAAPMFRAFELHKVYQQTREALGICQLIADDAWRTAASFWLRRRLLRQEVGW